MALNPHESPHKICLIPNSNSHLKFANFMFSIIIFGLVTLDKFLFL